MSKILVTGGAGYIGSHTIVDLIANGFDVVSVDNFSRSDKNILSGIEKITGEKIKNYQVDLTDYQATRIIFEENPDINGVIHFAAFKTVPESVAQPLLYYHNNMVSLTNLLRLVKEHSIKYFVFSSSCSVYGNADELPVTEDSPLKEAESPYARTKQMGEDIIKDISKAQTEANFILLRYFNPVGAHPSAEIGEMPIGVPNNLVPFITQTAAGKREQLTIFGEDYETPDGTCVRDYIHVMDIANAHTKALLYLLHDRNTQNCEVFNLGTGSGVSVLEAVKAFEKVTGEKLNYKFGPRRPGDVVAVYANNNKAKSRLQWQPEYSLDQMMLTAWNWEKQLASHQSV